MPITRKRKIRKRGDKTKKPKSPWTGVLTGTLLSVPVSLALVALAALLLTKGVLPFESVPIINPVIKAVSAAAAGFVGARRAAASKPLFGAAAGAAYIAAATLCFALFAGGFAPGVGTLLDLATCALAGAVGGACTAAVNTAK